MEIKRRLLKLPPNLKLNPVNKTVERITEFFSEEQLECFNYLLERMGYSIAICDKQKGQNTEVNLGNKSDTCSDVPFYSRAMISVVPIAACEFSPDYLLLHSEPLVELKLIDDTVDIDDEDVITDKCEQFLRIYGSHVNGGYCSLWRNPQVRSRVL